ncbi:glutamate decarboxylase [bacterium]|nr:glutamate decarboxylase [bacterium]
MTSKDATRDLFFQQDSEIQIRKHVERSLEIALSFLKQESNNKIHSDLSLPDLEALFHEVEIPALGLGVEKALKQSVEKVVKHSVHVSDPRYIGHMTGATPTFHMGLELLIAAMNQNVVKIETALSGSFVEGQLLAWIHRLIFNKHSDYYKARMHKPELCFGNVTGGGTMGNLTALAVARNKKIPRCRDWGIFEALERMGKRKVGIYASKRVHYSIRKAASVLGFGTQSVHEIPVIPFTNQIDIAALERVLTQHQAQGILPLVIVGVAGSTETGSADDFMALSALAQRSGAWFHVDAAWGGPLLLCEQGRTLLKGIELADSVVMDGHKLFSIPMAQGMVLFKDESALDVLRHSARYIIRAGSVDLGRTSLEGSRRFDSFKLWFAFWALGRKGYSQLVEHSLQLGQTFAKLIETSQTFQLTSEVKSNIVTWRYVPARWKARLDSLRASMLQNKSESARDSTLQQLTALLNEATVEIQKIQRQNGKSFVSRTTLESVLPGFDTVVFRAVLFHPLTSSQTLTEVLSEQKDIGQSVMARLWPRFETQLPGWDSPTLDATEN